jgi:hypothetical protein
VVSLWTGQIEEYEKVIVGQEEKDYNSKQKYFT